MQGKITRKDGSEVVIEEGNAVCILQTNDKMDDVCCNAEGTVWNIAGMIVAFLADDKDVREAVMLRLATAGMDGEAADQ